MKNHFEKFNWQVIGTISLIAVAMMVTFVVVNIGRNDEISEYIAQYNYFKQDAEQANFMVDELRVQVAEKEQEVQEAMTRASQLSLQARQQRDNVVSAIEQKDELLEAITDSVEMARVIIPAQEEIIEGQTQIINTQDEQITHLNDVIVIQKETNQLLTFAVDSLQKVVINIPPPPNNPNKMFGITLPTRTQTFVGGVVIGVITSVLVLK